MRHFIPNLLWDMVKLLTHIGLFGSDNVNSNLFWTEPRDPTQERDSTDELLPC